MPSPSWIKVVIALLAAGMVALSWLTGDSIDEQGLRWLGGLTGAITLLLLVVDRWAWRWPLARAITERLGYPVLHGTWEGRLEYEADELGRPGSDSVYMAIHQTLSAIKIQTYFGRTGSTSRSLSATLVPGTHQHILYFIYFSQAAAPNRDTNRPHEGAAALSIVGKPVEEIAGSYFTDRRRRGQLQFTQRSRKVAGSYEQASRLEFKSTSAS
jgi:hypothetical protein